MPAQGCSFTCLLFPMRECECVYSYVHANYLPLLRTAYIASRVECIMRYIDNKSELFLH